MSKKLHNCITQELEPLEMRCKGDPCNEVETRRTTYLLIFHKSKFTIFTIGIHFNLCHGVFILNDFPVLPLMPYQSCDDRAW